MNPIGSVCENVSVCCELFCKYFAFFCIINCTSPLFADRTIIVSVVCALFVFEVKVVYMKYHMLDPHLHIPQYRRMLMCWLCTVTTCISDHISGFFLLDFFKYLAMIVIGMCASLPLFAVICAIL